MTRRVLEPCSRLNPAPARQRVRRVGHQQELLLHHRRLCEIRAFDGERQQRDVHRARAQAFQQVRRVAGRHLDVHTRMPAPVLLQ